MYKLIKRTSKATSESGDEEPEVEEAEEQVSNNVSGPSIPIPVRCCNQVEVDRDTE